MTTTPTDTCSILDYLKKNDIDWFPINVELTETTDQDGNVKIQKNLGLPTKDYLAKMTDFQTLNKEQITERQKWVNEFPYIAIDTNKVHQIDVDTDYWDDTLWMAHFKENLPYFLSATKGYPHLFCKFDDPIPTKRAQSQFVDIEVLSGQWSLCRADAEVYNCNLELKSVGNGFLKDNRIDNTPNRTPLQYSNVTDIADILDHLSPNYCDSYDTWLRVGASLVNSGFKEEDFDKWSQKSHKYDSRAVSRLWLQLERKPLENVQFGTIMYYLKESDPLYFEKIKRELKTPQQVEQYKNLLKQGIITDAIASKIFYEQFKGKYQYSQGYWYRLNDGGIYRRLDKDSDVHLAKDIKEYLQEFLHSFYSSTDEEKRKVLKQAVGKVESNKFKMSCVAESKQDFINEKLYFEMDKNPYLIGFDNGVFDLQTMTFRKATVEDKVSMTVGYDYTPLDPHKFNYFDDLISGYFGEPETAWWFKKHLGSLLLGKNKEESAYFWVGVGRNGKGTIDGLLERCLGSYYTVVNYEYYTCAKKSSNSADPEVMNLKDKRIAMSQETEGNHTFLTSKFKKSSGNDTLSGRGLYREIESFDPTHKGIIQTNHLPAFTDTDDGLGDRIRVIRFIMRFMTQDNPDFELGNPNHKLIDINLKERLEKDYMHFMHCLIEWYKAYLEEGILTLPEEIREATESYRADIDTVKSFVRKILVKTDDTADKITVTELLEYHNLFAPDRQLKNKLFKKELVRVIGKEIKRERFEGRRVDCVSGYTLNNEVKLELIKDSEMHVWDEE